MYSRVIKSVIAATASLVALAPAHAEAGDWIVRLRAILVEPTGNSGDVTPIFAPGSTVKVGSAIVPELDITYMWTNNIGTELILGTSKHKITGKTGDLNGFGKIASTWVLPPTLTLQYHFNPDGPIRPYLGAGVNYTIFYSRKADGNLTDVAGDTSVKMKNSLGYALQAGFDLPVSKKVFVNLDFKYIDMRTTARLETADLGTLRVRDHLNPLVAGLGIGMRF